MATQVANPSMPVLMLIPGGFMHGKIVRIQGTLSPAAQRFAINLQCGPNTNPRDDLALHINARIQERAVVRNSLIGGHWGQEERQGSVFPFIPGQGFEVLVLADAQNYKIAINGQHFAEFRCRTPMERVSYLSADGDMMIYMISFEGGSCGVPGQGMSVPMSCMPHQHAPHHGQHQHPTYPVSAGMYPMQQQPAVMPLYPTQPGMAGMSSSGLPSANNYKTLSPKSAKKAAKKQSKNKAIKYGLAGAGVGLAGALGAYAISKEFSSTEQPEHHYHHESYYHGHRHEYFGSSSSSDDDYE